VNRTWLQTFACGAAVASIASVGAWIYSVSNQASKTLVLSYVKAEGMDSPKLPPDPAPQFDEPSEYLVQIARNCGIKSWTMQSEINLDEPVMADLEVPWANVSDKIFNCLTGYVRPPRVTLKLKKTNAQTH
jgi:hypothetical protein